MKNSDLSRGACARRLLILAAALPVAILGCKDALSPAAAARKLAFTVQPTNSVLDSSMGPAIAITVEDGNGNIVTASTVPVTIALGSNPSGADLNGAATISAIAGIATFPYESINRVGNGYTLTATATDLVGATSATFNVMDETIGTFSAVSTSHNATCGVVTSGAAYCWGDNSLGQLGNNSVTSTNTPIKVIGGLTFRSVSVGSGQYFACGLTTGGAAWCWGYNEYGQLGNGSFANSTVPVPVSGNLTFTQLTAGDGGQACGLVASGAAYCWGWNGSGQLGNNTVAFSSTPLPVAGGLSFATISAGEQGQTCGVTIAGIAYCWGYNAHGELGNGSTANSYLPVAVSGGLTFKTISTGFVSTCGVTTSNTLYCWGDNTYGELGNGSTTSSKVPTAVAGANAFSAVGVGDAFACGLTTTGVAYCWGYALQGQLGNSGVTATNTPTAVLSGVAFASISAGYASACATTAGGAALCWGDNSFGELGNGSVIQSSLTPVLVATPP